MYRGRGPIPSDDTDRDMPDLNPDILNEVLNACQAGAGEAADSLRRNLDAEVKVSVAGAGTVDSQSLPDGFAGPGLVAVLTCGSTAALVVFPESEGTLPAWYAEPDVTGQSKLATLSQELGMVLLPESHMPDDFKAAGVKSLAGALARGGVTSGAAMVRLLLESGAGKKSTAYVIWPATKPSAVLGAGNGAKAAKPSPERPATPKPAAPSIPISKPAAVKPAVTPPAIGAAHTVSPPARPPRANPITVENLPGYSRSLLRIEVPVIVTLAEKRQPLGWIVELGPGSIIQFDKSCEEMLELDVGGRPIATGEAVKVGDKFGLRITSVVLPEERFHPVMKQAAAGE